jgi:adenylate cyclase
VNTASEQSDGEHSDSERFLLGAGIDAETIATARGDGTLPLLLAEIMFRPGVPRHTLEESAKLTGVDLDVVHGLWRSLGFADPDPSEATVSDEDITAALTLLKSVRGGDLDLALQQIRTATLSLSKAAEALADNFVTETMDGLEAGVDADTVAARVLADDEPGRVIRQMTHVLRHQMSAALRRARGDVAAGLDETVGFVDLVDYTKEVETLSPEEVAHLVERFEALTLDRIAAGGGRVVKLVGDAVLFHTPDAEVGAHLALDLVLHITADPDLLTARAGLARGPVARIQGDIYGPAVNRASRLAAFAEPGTVLAGADVVRSLGEGFATTARGSVVPKGLEEIDVFTIELAS